jgi:delta24(24(1))-sterol reductase
MASHDPAEYKFWTPTYVFLFATLLTAYYMYDCLLHPERVLKCCICSWDTSMSQKSRFKMQGQGIHTFRNTFPQLPGGTIKNPEFIQTKHGYASRVATSCLSD